MERELFLPLRDTSLTRERVNAEIDVFKKILPMIESFQSFGRTHDVFDFYKRKKLQNNKIKSSLYHTGFEYSTRFFALCKN